MATIVEVRVLDNVIVTDGTGRIVWNAPQQDRPVIRRKYDDGTIDVIAQDTKEVIMPPYDPEADTFPTCQHCGKRPW